MGSTPSVSPSRDRAFKGAVAGKERRKATVTGYCFATQPAVEVRLFRDHRTQGEFIDMTLPQAREMVRLLLDAIERAANIACHDRNPLSDSSDRASLAGDQRDVRSAAEA